MFKKIIDRLFYDTTEIEVPYNNEAEYQEALRITQELLNEQLKGLTDYTVEIRNVVA